MRITKSSRRYPLLNDESWVRQRYEAGKKTIEEIANEVGCSTVLVLHAMRRFGIESRKRRDAQLGRPKVAARDFPDLYNREWLLARISEGKSGTDIADLLKCSITLVCR